jgi:hypothetical protein
MKRFDLLAMLVCPLALAACGAERSEEVEQIDQHLVDAAAAFGFESPTHWTVSSGTKSSTTDRTQGAAALALNNFSWSELTSAQFGSVSGVTSSLLLDVKPPTTPGWGQVSISVTVPSANVWSETSNTVSIAGLTPNAYSTLAFTLPAAAVTALQSNATDKTIKVSVGAPQSSSNFKLDNLRFQGSSTNSLVEMRVSDIDDWVFVTVNGVRRGVYYYGDPRQGQRVDVSSWFGSGANSVRLQNINTIESGGYRVELWVDGVPVRDENVPGLSTLGLADDRTLTISTPSRPALRTVTVSSSQAGKLYINDVYTGLSTPATLSLPQGSYKLGLGVSTDTPPNYTGSFYEQTVTVGGSNQSVNMTSSGPLPVQKTNTIAFLPIQFSWNYTAQAAGADPNNLGVLTTAQADMAYGTVTAIGTQWIKPFSYGLTQWQVTRLPMATTPIREIQENNFDLDLYLTEAGLTNLRSQYDRIVFMVPQFRADGTKVQNHLEFLAAPTRQNVIYTTEYLNQVANQPNAFLFHETLHNHEFYNDSLLHEWNGIDAIHGAETHGYPNEFGSGATDFVNFYRMWLRGQVAETADMRPGVKRTGVPATGALYVGAFKTLRVYTGKP